MHCQLRTYVGLVLRIIVLLSLLPSDTVNEMSQIVINAVECTTVRICSKSLTIFSVFSWMPQLGVLP